MRYLTLDEVLELHRLALEQSGGAAGLRDLFTGPAFRQTRRFRPSGMSSPVISSASRTL